MECPISGITFFTALCDSTYKGTPKSAYTLAWAKAGTRKIIGEVGVDETALDSLHKVQEGNCTKGGQKEILSSLGGPGPGKHEADPYKQHA